MDYILKQLQCFWTFPSSISVVCRNMQEAFIFVVMKVLGLFSPMIKTFMWHAFWSIGSLLIGRTNAESDMLKGRVNYYVRLGWKWSTCVAVIWLKRNLICWWTKIISCISTKWLPIRCLSHCCIYWKGSVFLVHFSLHMFYLQLVNNYQCLHFSFN